MSDYGLRVIGSSGQIQIDSYYRNLSITQSGSSASVSNDGTSTGYYTSISITSNSLLPLILLQPSTDYYVNVLGYSKTSSNYSSFEVTTEKNESTSINWKCCRESSSSSSSFYGMNIYNSSGDLCFTSELTYFKILDVQSFTLDDPTNLSSLDSTTITHSSYSNPYYIIDKHGGGTIISYNAQQNVTYKAMIHIGVKKVSSTQAQVGWFVVVTEAHSGTPYSSETDEHYNPTMHLIICDA